MVAIPIAEGGVRLGTLVITYDKAVLWQRFERLIGRALAITALALAIILPASAYWGRRMTEPLVQVSERMGRISQAELDDWVETGIIEFLGKLSDVRPAIAAATVYVLPSYREGTPRTVLEAMAMGRPIITADAPGCRETVTDGENGYLVPVKSVDALLDAMTRLIEEPGLTARMGACSRRLAVEKYDVHKVNAVMLREMGIALGVHEEDDNA